MWYRFAACTLLGAATLVGISACGKAPAGATQGSGGDLAVSPEGVVDVGNPLYAVTAVPKPEAPATTKEVAADPIYIHDCRFNVIEKEEVPAQREGVLRFIGTEIADGEDVPADKLIVEEIGGEQKKFRRLVRWDRVKKGQLLAQLDDQLARDELAIKIGKIEMARADHMTSEKTRDEAQQRYKTQLALQARGATSEEEVRGALLTWEKYKYETVSKAEALKQAIREKEQAATILKQHQIRSAIDGVIKEIYKEPGEAVKASPGFEPVFQLYKLSSLRAMGQAPVQYLGRLRPGMRAVVEVSQPQGPEQSWRGHLQEVTCVAAGQDKSKPLVISGSEDATVRVWERAARREVHIYRHPVPVRAVACTRTGAIGNWCVSGATDGKARLWDLDSASDEPLRVLDDPQNGHHGVITCVAFSPDGKSCATGGGDDYRICIWNTQTGELRYRLPAGHRAAVSSVQFTPQSQLVSVGRDHTVRLWTLGDRGGRLEQTFSPSSGDVARLGVSPDGGQVLFDQGKTLQILSLPKGLTEGILQNSSSAANFTTLALFSPDARLILTAGAGEGRFQLWRAPGEGSHAREVRQLVSSDHAPMLCGDFSPDGKFIVAGTRDRQVMLFPVPSAQDVDLEVTGTVSLVEGLVESSSQQIRIWAEVPNPDGRLVPGTTVTMVIYPGKVTATRPEHRPAATERSLAVNEKK